MKEISDTDVSRKVAQRSPKNGILEKDIQRVICEWLQLSGYFFWRQNNVPVFQHDARGGRFRAMPKFAMRGLPDIMCIHKGRFIGLEVKVPRYWKRTDGQIQVEDSIKNNGGFYYLVTSLDEAQAAMKKHDVV